MKLTWIELPIAEIVMDERHPRRESGDLTTLVGSIRRLGVLQPILVDGQNRLIAGRRRLLAARAAGLDTIPALRADAEAHTLAAADIQADENLCRLPLTPDELESLIQRKRGLVGGRTVGGWSEVVHWLKRLIAPVRQGARGH